MASKYRLIILGAGFSRPAGFPLASQLWKEIRDMAASYPSDLRAHKFNEDLDHYIEFRKDAYGEVLAGALRPVTRLVPPGGFYMALLSNIPRMRRRE